MSTHARKERKQAEERQRLLDEASKLLVSSLDHQITLQEIAQMIVPKLADYCRIGILDEEHHIKDITVNHIHPEQLALVRALYEQYKDRTNMTYGLQRLLETGKPELISNVSDDTLLSRIQTGKLTFQEERFDLDSLVRETVENLQAVTPTHQLVIESRGSVFLYGDRDRIEQILVNLLTNAIKYSPDANKVLIRIAVDQHRATVSVQDFGIGIAEAHHQKIFERFYQAEDVTEQTYPGLGIGLYISQEIVQRHYGRVWVESQKGKGATFYMSLPVVQEG